MTTELQPEKIVLQKRADALDALRGIAILAMVLSGTIPFGGALPTWMYHAQVPPPNHQFNPNLPGLTWVDLVFPFFIFTLGAAIPLAQSRRMEKGGTKQQVIFSILKRGFLLASFAIVVQHFRPFVITTDPVAYKWKFGLIGFFLLFLMFGQFPKSLPQWSRTIATVGGWTMGILFLTALQYPQDERSQSFAFYRSDIILLILANLVVFASLIWLLTRRDAILRLGFLGCLFPLLLSFNDDGWITQNFSIDVISWLFNFDYLKYLFIAIPGTLVGDWIVSWLGAKKAEEQPTWGQWRYGIITILMMSINLNLLVGLQARWLEQTALISFGLCLMGYGLVRTARSDTEKLLKKMYFWGCYWLALGIAFEPYQGGIKKDSATMSYFFVTTAMSLFLLIALVIVIDVFQRKKWLQLFIDNGKNPMMAYVAFGNLLWPILELTGWQNKIADMTQIPWLGFLRGLTYTLIVALFVSLCTRLKLFWKT
ncbi:DUF5009 domain-containing protein [Lusitaniella coriacea LEGE 07157]|uniref:DUF5009 domain-containing protein n=1 Tax=Lusitaniella coriacea LEGE 07157 TaxID=945747 RepID=A0A8J7DY54_9CYAN|nr:DUF5009 domain-containing protein [Lusitaniella coriacea]MBE9117667.1 DUF5009 domain-containing protein [Lusitaniella coriacea LEGE 07157]